MNLHHLSPAHGENLGELWVYGDLQTADHITHRETGSHPADPLDTVMAEGGPYHVREEGPAYLERLRQTGRADIAERFAARQQPVRCA